MPISSTAMEVKIDQSHKNTAKSFNTENHAVDFRRVDNSRLTPQSSEESGYPIPVPMAAFRDGPSGSATQRSERKSEIIGGSVRDLASKFNSNESSPLHSAVTPSMNQYYDYEDDGEGSFDHIASNPLLQDDSPLFGPKSVNLVPDVPISRTFDQFGRRISSDSEPDSRLPKKKMSLPSPTKMYQKSYFDTVSSTKPSAIAASSSNDLSPRTATAQSMKRTTSFDNFHSLENTTKRPSQKFADVKKKDTVVGSTAQESSGSLTDSGIGSALARCLFCGKNGVSTTNQPYEKPTLTVKEKSSSNVSQNSIAIQVQPTMRSSAPQTIRSTFSRATQMYSFRHDQSIQVSR